MRWFPAAIPPCADSHTPETNLLWFSSALVSPSPLATRQQAIPRTPLTSLLCSSILVTGFGRHRSGTAGTSNESVLFSGALYKYAQLSPCSPASLAVRSALLDVERLAFTDLCTISSSLYLRSCHRCAAVSLCITLSFRDPYTLWHPSRTLPSHLLLSALCLPPLHL